MKPLSQRTIKKGGSLSGTGIHTGKPCRIEFTPAGAGEGLKFFKKGKPVPLASGPDSQRCSAIGEGENQIQTVEHLLAALQGLGVQNLRIDVDGPELPALDGSALDFVKFLKSAGLKDLGAAAECFQIREPIFLGGQGKAIAAFPAEEFRVSYVLDYPSSFLETQCADFSLTPEVFEREIAPARTFCTEAESKALKEQGFGLGATYKNTLVISESGPVENRFRFPDECARHKILDLLGDLNLLGFSILGHVVGIRSGHSLNRQLVERIKKQRTAYGK